MILEFVDYHCNYSKSTYQISIYQYTKINNYNFLLLNVFWKIPQGSFLGLLLFVLYINDLLQVRWFDTMLFADDMLLRLSDKNLDNLENKVNND